MQKNNRARYLIEKVANIVYNTLNEARIARTIDPKIWATVASGISKKYRNDMGASAKPRSTDTKEVLIQKYVAALAILKQPCPTTETAFTDGKVFPLWAKRIIQLGGTLADVHKLYNENSATPVTITSTNDQPTDMSIKQSPNDIKNNLNKRELSQTAARRLRNKQRQEQHDENGIEVNVALRTLIPSTQGGGHEDQGYESYVSREKNIIQCLTDVLATYDTPNKKRQCRDGWYTTYWFITILDNANNFKIEIDITRERVKPHISYYVNGTYQHELVNKIVTLKDLYKIQQKDQGTTKSAAVSSNDSSLKKYKVTYISTSDDDICNVWVEAESKSEAEREVRGEYHDIDKILMVTLMR